MPSAHISRCKHQSRRELRPLAGGKFPGSGLLPYNRSPRCSRRDRGGVISLVASGRPGFELTGSILWPPMAFRCPTPPVCYGLLSALVIEVILTFVFCLVMLGATTNGQLAPSAGVPIGLPP